MKKLAEKKRQSKRAGSSRSGWRLWNVVYPKPDRISAAEPAGVLVTTSDIVPLPIAFVSSNNRNAASFARRLIAGRASFADVVDYRGCNWITVGQRVNGAILYPLDRATGKPDFSIDHLAAAQVFIDPLDGNVSFRTYDRAGLAEYLGDLFSGNWAIPRRVKGAVAI